MIESTHGEFRDYDSLQPILRRIADLRQISRTEIDRLAGFPSGLAAKALAEVPIRKLGPETLAGMAGALGLKFIAVDDPESLAKHTARGEKRVEKYALNAAHRGGAVIFKISLKKLRRLAKKGGLNSRKYMTEKKATRLAKRAVRARIRKQRERAVQATLRALAARAAEQSSIIVSEPSD